MTVLPHLLYMFEFVVDDLVVTHKNYCAPEEYPMCVEIMFRDNVFVSICDRDYGSCVYPCQIKNGKRCIFALESPVTDDDRLLIQIFKKQSQCCKYLVGLADIKIKFLFDRVKNKFDLENRDWSQHCVEKLAEMAKFGKPAPCLIDNCECFKPGIERSEQLCPQSEVLKQMIPLFNLCNQQTGNIILLTRLACHGPTITTTFCREGSQFVSPQSWSQPQICRPPEEKPPCLRFFACNADKLCPCDTCEDEFDRNCVAATRKLKSKKIKNQAKSRCI